SSHVNQRSGVSARLSITNYETLVANARRRAITLRENVVTPRISDLNYLYTSSQGKIELDPFREESLTETQAIERIIERAVRAVFLERTAGMDMDPVVEAIIGEVRIETGDMIPSADYKDIISAAPSIWEPVHTLGGDKSDQTRAACVEFLLEGLYLTGRLNRKKIGEMATYRGK
ncbi:MAG: magnesium chelatase, partial [Nitrospinota bacterium]|nr:magnesium chelatase [Nitrospinota bacterium]